MDPAGGGDAGGWVAGWVVGVRGATRDEASWGPHLRILVVILVLVLLIVVVILLLLLFLLLLLALLVVLLERLHRAVDAGVLPEVAAAAAAATVTAAPAAVAPRRRGAGALHAAARPALLLPERVVDGLLVHLGLAAQDFELLLAQPPLHQLQLPVVLLDLLLLLRVDRVELGLEERHVPPALQVLAVLPVQLLLEPLVLVHERRPHRLQRLQPLLVAVELGLLLVDLRLQVLLVLPHVAEHPVHLLRLFAHALDHSVQLLLHVLDVVILAERLRRRLLGVGVVAEQLVQARAVLCDVLRERARQLHVGELVAGADVNRHRLLLPLVLLGTRILVRVVQQRRHLEQLAHGEAVARVQVLQVELDARLDQQLLGDRLEEGHAVLLGTDVIEDLHVLVVPVAEPDEDVGDQLEVRHLEVLDRDQARVAESGHDLLEVPQLAVRHGGRSAGARGRGRRVSGLVTRGGWARGHAAECRRGVCAHVSREQDARGWLHNGPGAHQAARRNRGVYRMPQFQGRASKGARVSTKGQ